MAKTAPSDPTDPPPEVPEERLDALYGLPLDEFTPARDALAKELRGARRREAADWVKALRKPSAPAWVVNQLARTQRAEAAELREAGEALRKAHQMLLAGEGATEDLRRAADRHRRVARALVATASGLLDHEGHAPTEATLEKVGQTLEALALDEPASAAFSAGRLTREISQATLGLAGAAVADPPIRRGPRMASTSRAASRKGSSKAASAKAADRTAEEEAAARREAAAAAERERERARELAARRKALEAAEAEERAARAAVERAQSETEDARRGVEEAASRLERAEAGLARAQAEQSEASERLDQARAELEELSS